MKKIKNFLQIPFEWFLIGFLLTPAFVIGGVVGNIASVQSVFESVSDAFQNTSGKYADRILAAGDAVQYSFEPVAAKADALVPKELPGLKVVGMVPKAEELSGEYVREYKVGQLQSQELSKQADDDMQLVSKITYAEDEGFNPAPAQMISHTTYVEQKKLIATPEESVKKAEKLEPIPVPVRKAKFLGWGKRYYGAGMKYAQRQKELRCMAIGIYFEARNEPVRGQYAVGQVIMNRVKERFYPSSVCKVVYQGSHRKTGCQFSFTCDGLSDEPRSRRKWRQSLKYAKQVMDGHIWLADIGNASHYHATYVNPYWKKGMWRRKRIGLHIFYRGKFLHKKRRYKRRRRASYRRRQTDA